MKNKGYVVLIVFLALLVAAEVTWITWSTMTLKSLERRMPITEDEWRDRLTPEQYYILRQQGTERPFSSPLNDERRPGTYYSADCDEPVFRSEQKFDSGTGWPSFTAPISEDAIELREDFSMMLGTRVEVVSKCGGHLGHVFEDGPLPTGLRYCINGDALIFVPDER